MNTNPKVRLNNKDWILLILALAEGESLTPVQLQKCLFLVSEKVNTGKDFYKFEPYDYGPFTPDIYRDAEELEEEGLVNIGYASNHRWKLYSINRQGIKAAEEITKRFPESVIEMVKEEVVRWVLDRDFRDLVKEIYQLYPDFATNSIFRG